MREIAAVGVAHLFTMKEFVRKFLFSFSASDL